MSFTQAKKDETNYIFKFTLGPSTDATQTATGGTITFGNTGKLAADSKTGCGYAYKLDGDPSSTNTKYALVKCTTALAVGDVVSISGYQTNGEVSASSTYGFLLSTDRAGTNATAPVLYTKKSTEETLTYTIKTGDVLVGQTDFYISRNPSKSAFLSGISIAR